MIAKASFAQVFMICCVMNNEAKLAAFSFTIFGACNLCTPYLIPCMSCSELSNVYGCWLRLSGCFLLCRSFVVDSNYKGNGILATNMTLAEIKTLQGQARIETRGFRDTNFDLKGFKVSHRLTYSGSIRRNKHMPSSR